MNIWSAEKINKLIAWGIVLLTMPSAQARVFALDKQHVAPYFKGNFGSSQLVNDAYNHDSSNAIYTDEVLYQYAGELGVAFLMKKFGMRLGFQGIYPQKMDNIAAKNASGTILFNLTSKVLGATPVFHLEYSFVLDAKKRFYLSGGAGVGTVTVLNDYVFTDAGVGVYTLGHYTDELQAYVTMFEGSLGYEFSMADNVACLFDMGYRYLQATDFKYMRTRTGFNGSKSKGGTATFSNGANYSLDMSSGYIGLGFKFYIN